jgi:hypothetical protein
MRNAQTLSTLPFGHPAPQVDTGAHHGLVEVHRYGSITIPVPAAPRIPLAPRHHRERAGGRRSHLAAYNQTLRPHE